MVFKDYMDWRPILDCAVSTFLSVATYKYTIARNADLPEEQIAPATPLCDCKSRENDDARSVDVFGFTPSDRMDEDGGEEGEGGGAVGSPGPVPDSSSGDMREDFLLEEFADALEEGEEEKQEEFFDACDGRASDNRTWLYSASVLIKALLLCRYLKPTAIAESLGFVLVAAVDFALGQDAADKLRTSIMCGEVKVPGLLTLRRAKMSVLELTLVPVIRFN